MRIGSFLMIMMFALIAFGFLLSDNLRLRGLPGASRQQIDALTAENLQLKEFQAEKLKLAQRITYLQSQIDEMKTGNPTTDKPNRFLSGPILFLLPILVLSVGLLVTYTAVRFRARLRDNKKNGGSALVQVTKDEMEKLIKMRRTRSRSE